MAISISDLHTEAGIKSRHEFLAGKSYFSSGFGEASGGYPHASRWYEAVSSHLATRFPGKAVGNRFSGQNATTVAAPAKEVKKEAPEADDDDDLDLFGDETEEENKAAEEREAAVRASSKKKESGKSSVLLDVKPWDDETDMKKLEEAVHSVEMLDSSKLAPVSYGIKKLQIMMTVVDDLVSVDNLIEGYLSVEPANEYKQSSDIVAFNKI